jgi:hypothetical protein
MKVLVAALALSQLATWVWLWWTNVWRIYPLEGRVDTLEAVPPHVRAGQYDRRTTAALRRGYQGTGGPPTGKPPKTPSSVSGLNGYGEDMYHD